MKVCAKRCAECLFSDARIVTPEAAAEIVAEVARTGAHFICHKAGGADVMCRGHYDKAAAGELPAPGLLKMCARTGLVRFVDPATAVDAPDAPREG
jgi:hypothetical protein